MRAKAPATAALLLAFVGVACDDGALTKEEFITRGDAICRDVDNEIEELPEPQGNPLTDDQVLEESADFIRRFAEVSTEGVRRLRRLEPPEEDRGEVDDIIEALEDGIRELEAAADAAEQRDRTAFIEAYRRAREAGARFERLAEAYGFKRCGGPE